MPVPAPLPSPFGWHQSCLRADFGEATVLFTTRRGGASTGPYASLNLGSRTSDEPSRVRENRERLAEITGLPKGMVASGRQVHGAEVRNVVAMRQIAEDDVVADGQATLLRRTGALVVTADCLPIALVAESGVAMVHAGWRGTAAGVIDRGVAALRGLGATGPIAAAIGPGAGGCCYEVGEEVHRALGVPAARVGERNLDLKRVAREHLERAEVAEVHDVGVCTMCATDEGGAPLFFSHRRDGELTGRQAGVTWRS